MDLQVNGKCVKVFETQYTSKKDGQKHQRHHFVIEVQDGNFPKKICFTVLDDERWKKMNVVEGGTYNVSFDVSSREYNGNWYTDINAWRALRVDRNVQDNAPTHTPTSAPTPAPVKEEQPQAFTQQKGDDLPF